MKTCISDLLIIAGKKGMIQFNLSDHEIKHIVVLLPNGREMFNTCKWNVSWLAVLFLFPTKNIFAVAAASYFMTWQQKKKKKLNNKHYRNFACAQVWGPDFTFSKMLATAKIDDGETSSSFLAMDLNRLSAVSLRPSLTSQNLSVFAVHRIITWSRSTKNFFQQVYCKKMYEN